MEAIKSFKESRSSTGRQCRDTLQGIQWSQRRRHGIEGVGGRLNEIISRERFVCRHNKSARAIDEDKRVAPFLIKGRRVRLALGRGPMNGTL